MPGKLLLHLGPSFAQTQLFVSIFHPVVFEAWHILAMTGTATKFAHDFDPLDEALRPPIDETEQDRVIRLAQEAEARRVSQAIDDSLKAEKQAQKKKGIVRLLLLGQSESGMSDLASGLCSFTST